MVSHLETEAEGNTDHLCPEMNPQLPAEAGTPVKCCPLSSSKPETGPLEGRLQPWWEAKSGSNDPGRPGAFLRPYLCVCVSVQWESRALGTQTWIFAGADFLNCDRVLTNAGTSRAHIQRHQVPFLFNILPLGHTAWVSLSRQVLASRSEGVLCHKMTVPA